MQWHAPTLDQLAQRARLNVNRRHTALVPGGDSLAALTRGPGVAARNSKRKRNKNKKCRKKARRRASQTCQQQIAQCEGSFLEANPPDLDERLPCCALLATCDYEAFFACLPSN